MPICDHIVFWGRNERRPEFTAGELESYQRENEKRILALCRMATARMIGRLRERLAEKKKQAA